MAYDECPACGLAYKKFRTGFTFTEVRSWLWVHDEDPKEWKYKRRGTVLGLWRMTKLKMWADHCDNCQDIVPF